MFSKLLFMAAKKQKQTKCPTMRDFLNKYGMSRIGYYAAMRMPDIYIYGHRRGYKLPWGRGEAKRGIKCIAQLYFLKKFI